MLNLQKNEPLKYIRHWICNKINMNNYEKIVNGDLFNKKLNIICKTHIFENIINGDFFINKLSLPCIINIRLCPKALHSLLSNEYKSASKDLNIYVWSRNFTRKVYIWGKAWSKNVSINYFNSGEDRICAGNMRHMNNGTTLLYLDECCCEDYRFFEFLENIYGSLIHYNLIYGKKTKQRVICPCPNRQVDYYI